QGSFRTAADPTASPPTITAFAPQYPSTISSGMPINASIDTLFSEPLDASTLAASVSLHDYPSGTLVAASVTLSTNGQVVRVKPTSLLTTSHQYYVSYTTGLKVAGGQPLQFAQNLFFSTNAANIADTLPPHLVSISPPDGSTGVGVNAHVHARFDEPINPFTLASTPAQTTFASVQWTDNNREVAFVRHEPYAASTQVTESVAAAQDYAGNAIATPNSTTFTTSAEADTSVPAVEDLTPYNGAQ